MCRRGLLSEALSLAISGKAPDSHLQSIHPLYLLLELLLGVGGSPME
jgi:hypothetical protein